MTKNRKREIALECNALAREIYIDALGKEPVWKFFFECCEVDYVRCWRDAAIAYKFLRGIDVQELVADINTDDLLPPGLTFDERLRGSASEFAEAVRELGEKVRANRNRSSKSKGVNDG